MNSSEEQTPAPRGGIVGFALGNPYFIIVGCLVVTIMGVLAMLGLPKDLLPSANMPAVQIMSFYSGMPVDHVAQDLSTRFELYTGQAIGVERQESKSLQGVSIVKNFFNSETELNAAISQTTSLVLSVLRKLPPGTQPPLIMPFDPMATTPLALIAVSGDLPEKTLYDIGTYKVRTATQSVLGAMAPTVMGGAERQIIVYLDPKKLRDYNLSSLDVLDQITRLNTFIPTGDMKMGDLDYPILSNGLAEKISDMNDFPIRSEEGTPVYLKQVGEAKDASKIQTNVVMVDGKRQVYVPIFRQPGANSIKVIDDVKAVIKKLQVQLKDVKLTMVADQSSFIRHAIESIAEETLIGGGLAAILVLLFLGNPRASLGLLLTIPLSLLISFLGLQATHQTLNAMTLGGLALAIGVLVDNSIVVLENISNKLNDGMAPEEASYRGAAEVAMPVLASTLATLVVLFPVVFLSGIVKVLFGALTKSVMFAMIGSYFTAMTVMPLFAAKFLKRHSHENKLPRFFQAMERLVAKITFAYGKLLHRALQNGRKILAALVVALVVIAIVLAPHIGSELFPRADAGNFMLSMRFPSGTRIEKSADYAVQVDHKLREWIDARDLKMIITNAGLIYGLPAAYTPNTGTQDVSFNIELTEDRKKTTQDYAKIIRKELPKLFPGVTYNIELGGLLSSALNGGLPSPIDIQIEGPKLSESHRIAEELLQKIVPLKGAVQARVQQRDDAPQIDVNFDRKKSMAIGLYTEEMVKNIVSAVNGSASFSPTVWIDPKSGVDYLLGVQFKEGSVSSLDELKSIPITGRHQDRGVPLSDVASLSQSKGPSEINHVNLKPVIDIFLDAENRDIGSLSKDVEGVIKNFAMPEGYHAEIRGEIQEMNNSVGSLGGGFLLATVLVYLILVVQFKSFGIPLIIMITVPMGLVGIIIMLACTNTYFSVQAAIGAIFMIGIAVANAVLLIEFILHKAHASGMNDQAILEGAKARLRPILMTSLASVLGLVPMAIGLGHGSEANIPLGRAVIGGQLLSVTLTLFIVPILVKLFLEKKRNTVPESKPMTNKLAHGSALVLVVMLSALLGQKSFAQSPQVLTPSEVIQQTLANHPGLKSAKLSTKASEEAVGAKQADYLPKIELDAIDSTGFPGSTGLLGIGGLVGSPYRSGASVGAVATMKLYDFGRTANRVAEAKSEVDLSKVNEGVTEQNLKQEALTHLIACAYWVSLNQDVGNLIEESKMVEGEVKRYVRTGQRSAVESYLVQSQTEEIRTQLADSESRRNDELKSLSILMSSKASFSCPDFSGLDISDQALASPDRVPVIELGNASLHIAEDRLKIAQADFLPELVGMASVGALENARLVNKQDYSLGIGLRFPLFEGFKTTHEVHAARASVDAHSAYLDSLREEYSVAVQAFDEKIRSAELRLEHLKTEQKLAEDSLKLAKQRYHSFEGSLIDLRESLRNELRVLNQQNDAKRDWFLARMQKAVYAGGL